MPPESIHSEIALLLQSSQAEPALRRAIDEYAHGRPCERLAFRRGLPRQKVLRLLAQLVHQAPDLALAELHVDAHSGCADFRGRLAARCADGARYAWEFTWDCRWRAVEQGWMDHWGTPDQTRAAREFGWRCFARWESVPSDPSDFADAALPDSSVEQRA